MTNDIPTKTERREDGWYIEIDEDGEWHGPFPTARAAHCAIRQVFNVDYTYSL